MSNLLQRYAKLPIAFHWITLLLIIAVYACIELRVFYPKGSEIRDGLKHWHYMLGITLWGLTLIRLAVRWFNPAPPKDSSINTLQRFAASSVHFLLYALLVIMPLLGWALLSAEGKPLIWFGLQLPSLIGVNEDLAKQLKEIHATMGTFGYFLMGFHALAALFHHYVKQDNTLLRMLPARA